MYHRLAGRSVDAAAAERRDAAVEALELKMLHDGHSFMNVRLSADRWCWTDAAAWRRGEGGSRRSWRLLCVLALPGGMRYDGVDFLRADTHRGWGIPSIPRAAAR
jgi:hypothetical protein